MIECVLKCTRCRDYFKSLINFFIKVARSCVWDDILVHCDELSLKFNASKGKAILYYSKPFVLKKITIAEHVETNNPQYVFLNNSHVQVSAEKNASIFCVEYLIKCKLK